MNDYMILLTESGPVFFILEECPGCDGSGKTDPHVVFGGRAVGGGVCPICRGNRNVVSPIDPKVIPAERLADLRVLLAGFAK